MDGPVGGGSDTGIPACEIESRSHAVPIPAILTNELSHRASAGGRLACGEAKHRWLKPEARERGIHPLAAQ